MADSGGSNGGGTGSGSGGGSASAAVGPLAGKVQTDKVGYASELVAYRVVDKHGGDIAEKVIAAIKRSSEVQENAQQGDDPPKGQELRVLLVDGLDYEEGGIALAEVKTQTKLISDEFGGRKAENYGLLHRQPRERVVGHHSSAGRAAGDPAWRHRARGALFGAQVR